ncbi:hypothetical protein B0H14DRAFT_3461522 [Mycena olivaceomarginata]|nr:hypothetical protein B0H14DRAFT_3461522 [Mycena olivaceomarginata]
MIRAKGRMIDSSGLTKKRRSAQTTADSGIVVKKRAKNAEKKAKAIKVNAALDELTGKLWLTKALVYIGPGTGKSRTNDALDQQSAWHRRYELPSLKKKAQSQIPGVSKLSTPAIKYFGIFRKIDFLDSGHMQRW